MLVRTNILKTISIAISCAFLVTACEQKGDNNTYVDIPSDLQNAEQPDLPVPTSLEFATTPLQQSGLTGWKAISGASWILTDLGANMVLPSDGRIMIEVNTAETYNGGTLSLSSDANVTEPGNVDFLLRAGCVIEQSEAKGLLVSFNLEQTSYSGEYDFKDEHNCFQATIWARKGTQVSANIVDLNFKVSPAE